MLGGGVPASLLVCFSPISAFCLNSEWLMPQWHRNQVIITAFTLTWSVAAATSGRTVS